MTTKALPKQGKKGSPTKKGTILKMDKVLGWLLIAFAVFYLLSKPVSAAHAVKGMSHSLIHAADQLAVFFSALSTLF